MSYRFLPRREQAFNELTGHIPGKTLALTASMDYFNLYAQIVEMAENQSDVVYGILRSTDNGR